MARPASARIGSAQAPANASGRLPVGSRLGQGDRVDWPKLRAIRAKLSPVSACLPPSSRTRRRSQSKAATRRVGRRVSRPRGWLSAQSRRRRAPRAVSLPLVSRERWLFGSSSSPLSAIRTHRPLLSAEAFLAVAMGIRFCLKWSAQTLATAQAGNSAVYDRPSPNHRCLLVYQRDLSREAFGRQSPQGPVVRSFFRNGQSWRSPPVPRRAAKGRV